MQMKRFWKNSITLSIAGLGFLAAVWAVAYFAVGNEYLLPSPWQTLKAGVKMLGKGYFYTAFFATLFRAALAFFLALLLGGGFAVAAYLLPSVEKFLRGIIAVLRALPTVAVLLLILVGASPLWAPVIIGSLTLFPLLYTAAYSSLCGVDRALLEMCKVYRVPVRKRVKCLYLPHALPKLAREGVAAFSFSLKLTVSAEVLAFTYKSMGGLLQEMALSAEVALMTALTLFVCLLGLAIEMGLGWALKRWEEKRCA